MKKRVLALLLVMAMAFTACGTGSGESASGEAFTIEKDGETVYEVSAEYAWLDTLSFKDTYESFFGETFWDEVDEDGVTYAEVFKEELLNDLKMRKVVVLEAEAAGITLSDEEKAICTQNAEEYIDSITEDTREKTGISVDTLAEFEMDYAVYEKYEAKLLEEADVVIDEEAVRQSDLFVLHFPTYEETEAGEIIDYDDSVKADIKKEAEAAYAMLEEGKTMEEVAEANDMDPQDCMWTMGKTAEEDQDEYYDEAFETAAFSLEEGAYSDVVEGIDGYYIIQMLTLNNEEETALAMEDALDMEASEIFAEIVEEAMDKYEITINDSVWETIDLKADIAFVDEEEYYEESHDHEAEESTEEISEEEIETEG